MTCSFGQFPVLIVCRGAGGNSGSTYQYRYRYRNDLTFQSHSLENQYLFCLPWETSLAAEVPLNPEFHPNFSDSSQISAEHSPTRGQHRTREMLQQQRILAFQLQIPFDQGAARF